MVEYGGGEPFLSETDALYFKTHTSLTLIHFINHTSLNNLKDKLNLAYFN
jgi:hypothetical protein